MGQINYLSTLKFVDAVVGNSSSGFIRGTIIQDWHNKYR